MSDDLDKPYFTMNNLNVRFEESCGGDISMFYGYQMAIGRIIPGFQKIANAIQNSDDVTKKALLALINEHYAFNRAIDRMVDNQDLSYEEWEKLPPPLRPSHY